MLCPKSMSKIVIYEKIVYTHFTCWYCDDEALVDIKSKICRIAIMKWVIQKKYIKENIPKLNDLLYM